MQRPPLEVADIVRAVGKKFVENNRDWITRQHLKVLKAIKNCRTADLGYHFDKCTHCGYSGYSFNSCLMVSSPLHVYFGLDTKFRLDAGPCLNR